jgi:hypothetical protein
VEGFNQERRGLFDGLKVPFDVNAILLSAAAVMAFVAGCWVIEVTFHMPQVANARTGGSENVDLIMGMFQNITSRLGWPGQKIDDILEIPHDRPVFDAAVWIAFLGWFSVVWAFFSGAICRIAAMKIAREEGLELRDAVKFGMSKFVANLLSIVFVVALIGFFYLICNATIAGLVGRIPWIGEILVGVLFFLVLLSSFFIVFAGVLGILGFNLASAAIATEASDTFDGVSRAWNYILARPWQVILTYSLTAAYIGIFLFCGHNFEKVCVRSLTAGDSWGIGNKPRYIVVDDSLAVYMNVDKGQRIAIPGKGEFLYQRLVAKNPAFNDVDNSRQEGRDRLFYKQEEPDARGEMRPIEGLQQRFEKQLQKDPGDVHARNHELDVWLALDWSLRGGAWMIWFWLWLARLIIFAYAVSYFFSSMTTIYFLLRKDVEGDDYTEINLEEDEDEDEVFESTLEKKPAPPSSGEGKPLPLLPGQQGPEKKDEPPKP